MSMRIKVSYTQEAERLRALALLEPVIRKVKAVASNGDSPYSKLYIETKSIATTTAKP